MFGKRLRYMLNRYSRIRFTKKTSNCYLPTSDVRCSHYFRRVKSVNLYSIFSTECDFRFQFVSPSEQCVPFFHRFSRDENMSGCLAEFPFR